MPETIDKLMAGIAVREAHDESLVKQAVAEIDSYIDGVESVCKTASLNDQQAFDVWTAVTRYIEKQAADAAPMAPEELELAQIQARQRGAQLPKLPTDAGTVAKEMGKNVLEGTGTKAIQSGVAQGLQQMKPAPQLDADVARAAELAEYLRNQQLSRSQPSYPNAFATGSPEYYAAAGQKDMPTRSVAATPLAEGADDAANAEIDALKQKDMDASAAQVPMKDRMKDVNWGIGPTWMSALKGAGGGALLGLLTAALSKPDKEGRKPYLRNALLTALMGGAAAPYVMAAFGKAPRPAGAPKPFQITQ